MYTLVIGCSCSGGGAGGGLVVHCVLLGFRVGDGNIAGFEPPGWTQQTEESERWWSKRRRKDGRLLLTFVSAAALLRQPCPLSSACSSVSSSTLLRPSNGGSLQVGMHSSGGGVRTTDSRWLPPWKLTVANVTELASTPLKQRDVCV